VPACRYLQAATGRIGIRRCRSVIPDTARVLGRMFGGIEFRGFAQDTVEHFADHAGVPVWNGLTDAWHPTQMLADILRVGQHERALDRAAVNADIGQGGRVSRAEFEGHVEHVGHARH